MLHLIDTRRQPINKASVMILIYNSRMLYTDYQQLTEHIQEFTGIYLYNEYRVGACRITVFDASK